MARIQYLEKTSLGWHIRFTAEDDSSFWFMVDKFKGEQRQSLGMHAKWNPGLFNGKGGWFCSELVLKKYRDCFENYSQMRTKAQNQWDMDHQENLWDETASERKEQEEEKKRKKEDEEKERIWKDAQKRYQRARERERQWDQFDHEQSFARPPARPTGIGFTITEALLELGFSALAKPTEQEVKKAFRQLAMQKHPDHGGSHDAMIKLNKAYQLVLWHVQQGVKV